MEELYQLLRQRYAREAPGTPWAAYPAALEELEQVAREGGDAHSLAAEEQPGDSEEELRRSAGTRQRRWSRARQGFLKYLEEVCLPREQRLRLADVALLASRELYLHRSVRSGGEEASQAHGGSMPRTPPLRFPLSAPEADREQALAGEPVELPYPIAALDELGLRLLRRGAQFWLESVTDSLLGPEGPARRLQLRPGQELRDLLGHRMRLEEGALHLWLPPALALSLDPALLRLPPAVREAAESAAAVGEGGVAAGLVLRFGEPASMAQALRGEDPLLEVDRWWAALAEAEREGCAQAAADPAGRLGREAQALAEEPRPEEAAWQARLAELLERRDRLASLEALLRRGSPGMAPREAIDALDLLLSPLCDLCYAPLPRLSPLLRLVGQRQAGWWARPGRGAGGA